MKIVSLLLLRREDSIQMRDHGDAFVAFAGARQDKVIAEFRIGGWNKLSGKAEWRKSLPGEPSKAINSILVDGVTVDLNHLAQKLQRLRKLLLQKSPDHRW